jgi:NAD(P)-dependent dehydrogenase (short-subunit alcohol dehydrogenase family)
MKQRILVTGASSGLGMFTAARLAEAGCAVVASATKLAAGPGRFKESLGVRRISSPACRLLGEDRTSLKLVLTSESDPGRVKTQKFKTRRE